MMGDIEKLVIMAERLNVVVVSDEGLPKGVR